MSDENFELREQMGEIQQELRDALENMLVEVGSKLTAEERAEVREEFQGLDELLERLKTGLVWITLFGRVTVGKSALVNAILGEEVAKVNVRHGATREVSPYERKPWKIVDVPGVLDEKVMEEVAFEEAKRSHGHIFVLDSEPSQPEIELFDRIAQHAPDAPRIVFFNKFDLLLRTPKEDRESLMQIVKQKMIVYVDSPSDIVFGSARLYNEASDSWIRQEVPQLIERLYEGAGTLGQIMGILDPAQKAQDLTGKIKAKVLKIRTKIARRAVGAFAAAAVPTGALPFSSVTTSPSLMASMVFVVFKVMGFKNDNRSRSEIGSEFIRTCAQLFGAEVAVATGLEIAADVFEVAIPWWGSLITFTGLSAFRYNRAAVLGELAIEYASNDFSWGGDASEVIFERCKNRAKIHYQIFKSRRA